MKRGLTVHKSVCLWPQGCCGGSNNNVANSNGGPQELQMSENLIYYSREEGKNTWEERRQSTECDLVGDQSKIFVCLFLAVNEFWVTIQRTEASERCGLSGSYWLKAENDALFLKDSKIKKNILVWPYKLLRRYGRDRVSHKRRYQTVISPS